MKERCKKLAISVLIVVGAGMAYFLLYQMGLRIPCPFYLITGFFCPGCGVSRMAVALLQFRFAEAFSHNPGLLLLLPVILALLVYQIVVWVKTGKTKQSNMQKILIWTLVALLLLYGVLRNLPAFAFLAP